mmetsp:Transcript_14156/g.21611  ORF Transcript_14156/g.21611 Transcript_14156/m.21611 type:complete len:152 (-) Transcript_14156:1745-2200(-)
MIPRTNLRSNKRKRNHKNIQLDINGVSDDDSFMSQSPLISNISAGKNEATLISMDYPFVTFRLQGPNDCRIEKATHVPSRQAVIGSITKRFARLIKVRKLHSWFIPYFHCQFCPSKSWSLNKVSLFVMISLFVLLTGTWRFYLDGRCMPDT